MSEHCTCSSGGPCQVHDQIDRLRRELAEARDENDRLRSGLETLRAAFIIAVGDQSPFAKAALDAADSAMESKP